MTNVIDQVVTDRYALYHADCIDVARTLPDDSVDYSVFSPPFGNDLYAYTNSSRDMGNGPSYRAFARHYTFLARELLRVVKPGRLVSVHCMDLPRFKERHGYIGMFDFPGSLTRLMERAGFIYHAKTMIRKNPVVQATRTNAIQLLHNAVVRDSSFSGAAIADYLITFRRPGQNPEPIKGCFTAYHGTLPEPRGPYTADDDTRNPYSVEVWQRYAESCWMDIDPGDTLQYASARESDREKHICPLQVTVYRRGYQLWTNPGDVVFEPFGGIGSGGAVAMEQGRRYIAAELKQSYFKQMVANLDEAEQRSGQLTMLELVKEAA